MQLENSEHSDRQYFSTSNLANQKWKQSLASEEAQAEIEMLHDQVSCLQQYLSEQIQQNQALEQALQDANQELGLMNAELQKLVEEKLLFLKEREFAKTLPADGETSRKVLIRLLNKVDGRIAPSKELEHFWSTVRSNRLGEKPRFLL